MRRLFPVFLGALVTLLAGTQSTSGHARAGLEIAPAPANVVVLFLDDATVNDLTFMPTVQSEVVDKGVSFDNAYHAISQCCPARATLLTGQYAHNHRVLDNWAPYGGFPAFDDSRTIATWLDPFHRTAYIGKYLNTYGSKKASQHYVPPGWDRWKVPIGNYSPYQYQDQVINVDGTLRDVSGYSTTRYGKWTANFIAGRAARHQPFATFTSFLAPHTGYPHEADDPQGFATPYVQQKYRDHFSGMPLDVDPSFNEPEASDKPGVIANAPLISPEQSVALVEANQQRRESLLSVDDEVGRVIDVLRASGELDNTYILVFSDNGWMQGQHRILSGKVVGYEPSIRMPLMVRGPGIGPGTTSSDLVTSVDLAPTVLAMAGLPEAAEDFPIDGRDLLTLLDGTVPPTNRPVVIEAGPEDYDPDLLSDEVYLASGRDIQKWPFRGVVTRDGWKYIDRLQSEQEEMYDLNTDPFEEHNLFGSPGLKTQQERLQDLLAQYRACSGASCRSHDEASQTR